ncbi:aspartate/tyrosine/aromatic aminotransferase [Helicobacter sp. 11S03491-1]|uniref:aspartate/tyrosine/aromatic aminotransferase n=1 Tax=Helicobacter sp. 11S03491-1 TaxID=1476196 RepID=UPI000BA65A80|nr:aspartate/tyrosine/aromatic aminotransferase [Helicobacter sp. 11S03491-1]PAF43436.1 hypothetical protein BKH45_02065 [Helicobacter sp. 11S03491-1]
MKTYFNVAQRSWKNKIAYLDSNGYEEKGIYNYFLYQNILEYFDIYTRLEEGLENFDAIVIPTSIDEIYLLRHASKIQSYLEKGGILLSFAQNFLPWLPGNNLYIPSEISIKDRTIYPSKHSIFEGVREYDLNYRRGVKGFFNRGYFIPPKNAQIILKDNEDCCVAYIDRHSTRGIILSSAGADLLGFGIFDNNTARRMGLGLLEWVWEEIKNTKDNQ